MYAPPVSQPRRGRVYLVGAGPGDPSLITVRGRECLGEADLVLYDALVHPALLEVPRRDAELRYVGKRAGRASERQASINAAMCAAAREGKIVVRLKGGDPFLFGRGSEEAEVLAAEGIPFEVVPGVPSPLAASAYAGLSLTHRDLASSVAYVTATESPEKDRTSHDWAKLATATQTLVIFMGMRKLQGLMDLLMEHGRPPETPAAVVQWASLPTQKTVVGTVADIAARAREAGLGLPSLIIVGDVVRLREHLRWFDTRPLFGRRVLITRAPEQAGALARLVREQGGQPLLAPTIAIEPPESLDALHDAAREVGGYDWVVFTSANAVDAFWRALEATGGDARRFGSARVCVVGAKTAAALRRKGVQPDLWPDEARAEGVLAALLPELRQGARILFPRAEAAREVLARGLREAGHRVTEVTAYRTVPTGDPARVRALLQEADVVTFTSPSTLQNLLACAPAATLANKTLASIGPVTSAALQAAGLAATVQAPEPSVEALVEALVRHYERPS